MLNQEVSDMQDVLLGSVLSAMATGLGAVPILIFSKMAHKWRDVLLAFTAGVMMAAACFSLIPEAMDNSNIYVVSFGLLLGTFILNYMENKIPHLDLQHKEKRITLEGKAFLVVMAITMHNIPEGLSVGVSYAHGDETLGPLIALAIGLQNIPEGFLVALFLIAQNMKKLNAFGIATLTGTVEIFSSLLGYSLANYVDGLVPYGLSFAAGAMLFIVYKELIPESHGDGNETPSTYSFIVGLVVMLFLIGGFS